MRVTKQNNERGNNAKQKIKDDYSFALQWWIHGMYIKIQDSANSNVTQAQTRYFLNDPQLRAIIDLPV